MKVAFLAGAGGVGKTSVINEIVRLCPDVKVMPSVTRSVYEKLGLSTEHDFYAMSPEKKALFQDEVFKAYRSAVDEFLKANLSAPLVVIDRSAFDYASYQVSQIPTLSLDKVKSLQTEAKFFMSTVKSLNACKVYVFPYPVPWVHKGEETWRMQDGTKNFVWDAVLNFMIDRWELGSRDETVKRLRSSSIRGRAFEILGDMVL